jgi:membrane-bound serine protease (ClpP class)
MITRAVPGIPVRYEVIIPVVLALGVIMLFLGRLALRAQRLVPITGAEGLVNKEGTALTAITPEHPGQVSVHGEIWRALSGQPLNAGDRVRVTAVDGLTLRVELADNRLP